MVERLKKLCRLFGPSGREHQVIEWIRTTVQNHVDRLEVDTMGSLIAFKKGESDQKRIMFASHTDEIGVVTTYIDPNGFLQMSTIGGVDPKAKIGGSRVRFGNGIVGVVRLKEAGNPRNPEVKDWFVDIGVKDKATTESMIQVGEFGVFEGEPIEQNGFFISKAVDDRIGCLVLIETILKLKKPKYDTYFVFTTQEEVGCKGAKPAAYAIEPTLALAVDITGAGDNPENHLLNMGLGKGVAIKARDGGMIVPQKLVDHLQKLATDRSIQYHIEVLTGGTTDAFSIQLVKGGIPAGCLSIPTRYGHSPSEMIYLGDVEQAIQLALAVCDEEIPY